MPSATVDWMVSSDTLAAPIRPAECAAVEQNPPDFGWPDAAADGVYQVTLIYPDGRVRTLAAPQNWVNWDEVLPAGIYLWQVELTDSSGVRVSRAREFSVSADATPFLVPDAAALLSRITAAPHPRGLPDSSTLALMLAERQSAVAALQSAVASQLAGDESQLTLNSLMAYVYTRQDIYFDDALRRLLNIASWDPRGPTSYAATPRAARQIAWTLALGYDWLHPRLDAGQRNLVMAAIQARGADMYADIIGLRSRIATAPRDAEGNQTLTVLAAISTLLAGDLGEADTWLRGSLPLAINATSPWGTEEGGSANGDAFATRDLGELLAPWYILRWSAGVDLAQKPWVRNWSRFLAYFLPPGSPAGVFGDGAERALGESHARFAKGHASFAPTPLGRWHASQLTGEDPTRIEVLLSPLAEPASNAFPPETPNAAVLASLGQAALHSDLADPARVSIYFKSSPAPYGAFDHSHADQNSFVVNAGGQRLAIGSGYYDGDDTPHWRQWYKQTRAHNAITFDGGKGQLFLEQDGKMGYGAITNYGLDQGQDIVHGDATQAYGGALREAKRSIVYLRPNLVLVYDRLASDVPRRWEWNIHALNPMSVVSDRQIAIENNGQRLCVEMLAGPAMRFTQTDRFSAEPGGTFARQWHGTFSSAQRLAATDFIALLDVGCTGGAASASKTGGLWTVLAGNNTVTISDIGISVGPSASSALVSPTEITAPAPLRDTQAPSVPSGLVATAVSPTEVNLSWNASSDNVGVTGYYVYLNNVALATTTATSFTHTGLTAGTTYRYRVSAFDAVPNHSKWSAQAAVTTQPLPDTQAPSVPAGLVAAAVSSTQIDLAWSASTDNVGVAGYTVYLNDIQLATTTATSFSHIGLVAGTTYNYRVSAFDAVPNHSAWSSPLAVSAPTPPDTQAPSVPSGLAATAVSSTQITLTWNTSTDNVGVTGYRLFRDGVLAASPANSSASISGLSASRLYAFTVAALDAAGNTSAQSAPLSVTTPAPPRPTPYSGTPVPIPGTFEAENFDRGGEGVAYHDNVRGNAGGQYRPSEDVDIVVAGSGYVVNNFETGEWLAYSVNVAASALYDIEIRAASAFSNGAFHVEIDGVNVTGTVSVPNTGSWSTFQWVGKRSVALTAGPHLLKIVADQQYFDLDSIRVLATPIVASPYSGSPIAVPGMFEAENFDRGGEGIAYHDNVRGNAGGLYRVNEDVDVVAAGSGYVVNNFETGEWLAYTVNVAASALYDIEIRAASAFSNSAFHVEIDGVNVTGIVSVPNTGGWSTFQWVGRKGVPLSAGTHLLKIVSDQQYFDLDSIRVSVPASGTAAQVVWSTGMEDGTMGAWYAGGGGGEFNGHPGNVAGSVGNDGSTSAATQERAHSGAWSAKLTIPSNGAARLYRWNESRQNAELYYSTWYYFPQAYALSGPGAFWMLGQWKSSTPSGAHDPFFMLVAYSATPSTLNLGLAWFPLPIEGPLPGQSGYRLYPTSIQVPVGRWVHIETRYKSAGDFTGAIQTWIDGVEVLHLEGVRTRYPDGDTQWSVTSYAQGLSPAPAVIYVDDAVISQTRVGQ